MGAQEEKVVGVWSGVVGHDRGGEVGMVMVLLVDQRELWEGRAGEGMSFVLGEEGG